MRKQRNHYDKAFKENAVKLSLERKNVSGLAQELGIEPVMLYRWRKEFQNNGPLSFPGNGVQALSDDAKRISECNMQHANGPFFAKLIPPFYLAEAMLTLPTFDLLLNIVLRFSIL
jgi:transposase